MFVKPLLLQIPHSLLTLSSLLCSLPMHISRLTRLFARLLFQGLGALLLQWVRTYLHTHLLKTVSYSSTDNLPTENNLMCKSLRFFRNRSKKVKAPSSHSSQCSWHPSCIFPSSIPGLHDVLRWCKLFTALNSTHHLSKQPVWSGTVQEPGHLPPDQSTSATQDPGSGSFLLLWTENYCTSAAVANIEMFSGKCCCELEVQSKRLILQGYTLGQFAFLLEHYIREQNEKLPYTVKIKHLKVVSTASLGSAIRLHSIWEMLNKKNKGINQWYSNFMQLYWVKRVRRYKQRYRPNLIV